MPNTNVMDRSAIDAADYKKQVPDSRVIYSKVMAINSSQKSKLAQNCTRIFKLQCLPFKHPFNHIKRYWSRKDDYSTFMKNWRILFLAQDIVQFLLYYLYLMETFFKTLSHTLSKKYFETERESSNKRFCCSMNLVNVWSLLTNFEFHNLNVSYIVKVISSF